MILTIITVCFQNAQQLEVTIANVASVKREGISYIVIDGGSTDATLELLRQNEGIIDRWVSEPDRGIYDAMNKGWILADPESRIIFLGAGDRLLSLPGNLEQYSNSDLIYGDVMIGARRFHTVSDYRFRFSNTVHHQALLVPKCLHPDPPFDLKFRVYSDYDFNLRLLRMGGRYLYDPGLIGYAEPGGLSANKQHGENFMVVKKNFGLTWALCAAAFLTFRKLLECIGIRLLTP